MDRYDMTWESYGRASFAGMTAEKEGEYARCEDIVAKLSPLHEKCEALDELGEDNINEMSIVQLRRELSERDKLVTDMAYELESFLKEVD